MYPQENQISVQLCETLSTLWGLISKKAIDWSTPGMTRKEDVRVTRVTRQEKALIRTTNRWLPSWMPLRQMKNSLSPSSSVRWWSSCITNHLKTFHRMTSPMRPIDFYSSVSLFQTLTLNKLLGCFPLLILWCHRSSSQSRCWDITSC